MNNGTYRKRSATALICAIIALVWMLFCGSSLKEAISDMPAGDEFDKFTSQLSSMIAVRALTPFFIIGWLATIFSWVAFFMNQTALALTAAILYCVALILTPSYGFGLFPCIVLGFIAYFCIQTINEREQ